ncbi:MAG TPA: hypothetical protein VLZ12_08515 [Verrucomicrobiae bacterium]|nr:hypothetical protein [Verrucomicrobiae bacterium]
MRTRTKQLAMIALLPAVVLAFAGSANGQEPAAKGQGGAEGAIEASAIHVTATVVAVDAAKRTVSVVGPLGRTNTYTCGPAVRNFNQIKVGDKVKATFVESIAVAAGPSSAPSSVGVGSTVAVAPKGAMPGVVMAKTVEVTGKIVSIDAETRSVTLEGPAGNQRTVKAGPKVDLAALKAGDDVRLRVTEALAITVERPESGGAE